jgi:hypothetical protein
MEESAMRHAVRFLGASALMAACTLMCSARLEAQTALAGVNSAHFDVRYLGGVTEADARKTVEYIDSQYKAIQTEIGVDPKKKIEVRIYDNVGRYMAEAGLNKPWRGAIYARGILHCQPPQALIQRGIFEATLAYEVARAMIEPAGERGCPVWLRESYAVYHAGAYRQLTAPLGAKLSSFSDLTQDFQTYTEPPQRDDVQYMLGHTMDYFIQKYGEKKAFGMFHEFDGLKGLDAVFAKVYGEDLLTIEKGWAKYISYHTTPFKK